MLFNSYEFIFLYLPFSIVGYFYFGKRNIKWATLWLVIVSFLFYGWFDYRFVPLLFISICFNYFIGKRIEIGKYKRKWLFAGIAVNIFVLGYFKYTGFFVENINLLYGSKLINLERIILPLGISFFTFTQTGYLVDAYRGETRNDSFLTYCEFVTIFPHLIAGPIINHKHMLPQFLNLNNFKINYDNVAKGITLFAIGLFKKVMIADTLSQWVGDVFVRANDLSCIEAWIGALGYTLQLYFDFSAYSEMAIGLGLMLNMIFPVNFDSPYQARNIIEFWHRWHMTLGNWVKNYLYIPLGGNCYGELIKMRNLLLSMVLIGFWHGAGWTYIFWGAMHGFALVINHQWRRFNVQLPDKFSRVITFIFVMIAWVFFRAESFQDAISVLKAMLDIYNIRLPQESLIGKMLYNYGIVYSNLLWTMDVSIEKILLFIIMLLYLVFRIPNPMVIIEKMECNKTWLIITIVLLQIVIYNLSQNSEFLYFQF